MEFLDEDCKTILSRIQFEEKQLTLKRRWLMGLPTTSESDKKRMKVPKFLKHMSLPESLLREDDVSYEIVRTYVAKGFRASGSQAGNCVVQDYLHLFGVDKSVSSITGSLNSVLDDMNNIGLCRLANITTEGLVNFEKKRWKMKRVINEHLPKIIGDPHHSHHMLLREQLPQLLTDPANFQKNRVTLGDISHHYAATKLLLEGLENMPSQTLSAMHRKLRGAPVHVPQLLPTKSGWNRERLIKQLRATCENMLSEINEGDKLQKPLAKAMNIAALSLKLEEDNQNACVSQFCNFSRETEGLQNEILKSIRFLNEMNSKDFAVKELQCLLDPKAEIPTSHFRPAVRRMLTGYLFECSEMDTIPKLLLETLAIIKRSAQSDTTLRFSEEDFEDEVESLMTVSSQIRQISWDFLGDHKIDEEFSKAYMEDIQENDADNYRSEYSYFHKGESCIEDELESVGESRPVDGAINKNDFSPLSKPDVNMNSNSVEGSQSQPVTGPNVRDQCGCDSHSSPSCDELSFPHVVQNLSRNPYLAIQEICDETSLVAHQLIGRLLEEFLQVEGVDLERCERSYLRGGFLDPEDLQDAKEMHTSSQENIGSSIIVRAVEELLPSFPKSDIESLKELMGLQ